MKVLRSSSVALALLGIFGLATALRLHDIGAQSLWYDEGNSARIAERTIRLIVEGAGADIHPPGYYLLLKFWRDVFGEREWALRSLSAICGVITVVVTWRIGRLISTRMGLIAALLVAVAPFAIYYSQEARMYALLGLWATLSSWALVEFRRASEPCGLKWMLLYAVATAGGLYTQYAYPFVMLAHGIWMVLLALTAIPIASNQPTNGIRGAQVDFKAAGGPGPRLNARIVAPLAWYALANAAALLAFAPWMPIALRQIRGWPAQSEGYSLFPALLDVARWLVVGRTLPLDAAGAPLSIVALLLLLALSHVNRTNRAVTMLCLLWLFVPVGLLFAFSLYREAYLKVLVLCVPPLCILLALAIDALGGFAESALMFKRPWIGPVVRVTGTLIVAGSLLPSILNIYNNPDYARDDYRSIAAFINRDHRPSDAVIFDAPNQWEVFTYYQKDAGNTFPLTYRPASMEAAGSELAGIANDGDQVSKRIFVLYYAEKAADPNEWYERWLASHTYKAREQWIGNIRLGVYGSESQHAVAVGEFSGRDGIRFGPEIRLTNLALRSGDYKVGDIVPIQFDAVTSAPLSIRYKIFAHIGRLDAPPVASNDMEPMAGYRPTDKWVPGEVMTLRHGVWLGPDTPPGEYGVYIGIYDAGTGRRLTVSGASAVDNRLQIGSIAVR